VRTRIEKERGGWLCRLWNDSYSEIAYAVIGPRGPRLEVEFPSDWHEHRRVWVRVGLGLIYIAFSFPWRKVVPDQGQCQGPTYGFYCSAEAIVFHYGKTTGRPGDPYKFVYWPWSWNHVRHSYLNPDGSLHHHAGRGEYNAPEETKQAHPYTYRLNNGTLQHRTATINGEEREWRWRGLKWLPWPRKIQRTIDVDFDGEVGERTGSWKGGTTGCGWDWKSGESMEQALRRMERERRFR
jgi:hypothetical protein